MLVPPKSIARRRLQETCHGSMEIALSSLQRLFFCHLILMSSSIFHINSMHLCSHFVSLHFGGSETEGLNPCSSNTAIGRSRPTYKSPKPNWYNPSNHPQTRWRAKEFCLKNAESERFIQEPAKNTAHVVIWCHLLKKSYILYYDILWSILSILPIYGHV